MPVTDAQPAHAHRLGLADGRAAIESWWSNLAARCDDPGVLDEIPEPDLSGQWADSLTPRTLARACGVSDEAFADPDLDLHIDRICAAYEEGFRRAVERDIAARAQRARRCTVIAEIEEP